MITQVTIKNFKAIRNAKVRLTPLHLLIGPNDSGKTSILEAIAAICRSVDHTAADSFLGRWQGRELVHSNAPELEVEILADLRDDHSDFKYFVGAEFRVQPNRVAVWTSARVATSTAQESVLSGDPGMTLGAAKLRENVRSSPEMQRVADCLAGCWYLRWTARNLALPVSLNPKRRFRIEGNGFGLATLIDDLLNYDRDRFAELEREFIQIFPSVRTIALVQQEGFDSPVDQSDETLQLQKSPGKQIVFRLQQSNLDLPASQAAEGMLYVLGYLALMYLPTPPRVLLIEEPENGMHPHRVADIVRILRLLVARHPATQIVLTSHSPYLVDAFEPEEVSWCHRNSPTGDVEVTRLDIQSVQRSRSLFSLGEIWTGELEPQPATAEVP